MFLDEGADLDSEGEENCYDSLEELRRGAGLRKLPPTPQRVSHDTRMYGKCEPVNDSLEDISSSSSLIQPRSLNVDLHRDKRRKNLPRSHTFNVSMGVAGGRSQERGQERRRKLPQIPPLSRGERGHSADGEEHFGADGKKSKFDSGFIFLSGENGQSLSDNSGNENSSAVDVDSGCPSIDPEGEESSVDGPALLPKKNRSNFLWVDFDSKEKCVTRRPKNHDRLVQAKKTQHRHSAPPGSLDQVKIQAVQPAKKWSVPERSKPERTDSSKSIYQKSSSKIHRTHSENESKGIPVVGY